MKRWIGILSFVGAGALAAAYLGQASKLFVDGKVASTGLIERNGMAYVPLKDVAAALKMSVKKTARGYELTTGGGGEMVQGVNGNVGDTLFNGYARFQVVKVIRGKKYINQFSGDKQEVTAYPESNDLVIIVCRIKNGTKETQTCGLPSGQMTALTDTDEHSFGPRTGLSIDCPSRGQTLLPGAAVDFALTFDVPEEAKLKDLVYEVTFFGTLKASDKKFRVAL